MEIRKLIDLSFYPPSQSLLRRSSLRLRRLKSHPDSSGWMNAKRVTRCSLGESGYASAGSAEECGGATAVKPWGSTILNCGRSSQLGGD